MTQAVRIPPGVSGQDPDFVPPGRTGRCRCGRSKYRDKRSGGWFCSGCQRGLKTCSCAPVAPEVERTPAVNLTTAFQGGPPQVIPQTAAPRPARPGTFSDLLAQLRKDRATIDEIIAYLEAKGHS